VTELTTARLLLRQWRDDDLTPFAALNADPEVMRHLPARMTRAQSDDFARFIYATIERQGWGLWAAEVRGGAPFIGFVGLNRPRFKAHFTPTTEVGWRLGREYWGNGYATEAATAALNFAFDGLDCPEVVSFTATANLRSRRVMERLGMSHDPAEDFDHPNVPEGPVRRHVLYRMPRRRWLDADREPAITRSPSH
jgi:RimJ/RimL family protein N-acetyltransferase